MSSTATAPAIDVEAAEAPRPVSCEAGKPALRKFISNFKPTGLYSVIDEARKAESADGRGELRAQLEACEKQLAAIPADDVARFAARERRDRAWVRLEKEAGTAEDAGRKVWFAPWAIKAIRNDLRELAKAIEGEMERIVDLQVRFFGENDMPCDEAVVKANSPTYQAFLDFHERHLLPALAEFEFRVEFPDASPVRQDITQISWVLRGAAWRTIDTTK